MDSQNSSAETTNPSVNQAQPVSSPPSEAVSQAVPSPVPPTSPVDTPVSPETQIPQATPPQPEEPVVPTRKSSIKLLVVFALAIILLVLLGVIGYLVSHRATSSTAAKTSSMSNTVTPSVMPTPSVLPTPTPDSSDAGLQQSTQTIQTNISNLDTDQAKVDQGLNDQAIPIN